MKVIEKIGGPERNRTAGLLVANEALSQLSYRPTKKAARFFNAASLIIQATLL